MHTEHAQAERQAKQTRQQADSWQQQWQALGEPVPQGIAANLEADPDALQTRLGELITDCAQGQGQCAQLAQDLAQAAEASHHAETDWQHALASSPFADATAFQLALLPDDERHALQQRCQQQAQALQQAIAVHAAAQQQREQLAAQAPIGIDPVQLDADIATIQTEREAISQRLGAIVAQLAADAAQRTQQRELLARLAQQQADSDIWQRLDGLIGSAKGDKFRKFAQGLTLDHLVHLANRHLARLHGRYLLQRKDGGELELAIVDSWQGDSVRDTRTLSGGESFLVSLALALALSDLVSHKASIDSLFLDEGFGTLDADTLDIALDALDSLNASGKTIGVISHVEGLKERIPVQIRVGKASGIGHASLSVHY